MSGTDALSFTVYGHAEPAGSKTAGRSKSGTMFVRDSNPRSRQWKHAVAQVAAAEMTGHELLDGPIALAVRFVVVRPQGHYGKRGLKPSAPACPTVRPDLLKLARAVEDALTGIVYRDDAQIVTEFLSKSYGSPERVEIALSVCSPVQSRSAQPRRSSLPSASSGRHASVR